MKVNCTGLPRLALVIAERLEASSVQKLQGLSQHLRLGRGVPVPEPLRNNQDTQGGVGGGTERQCHQQEPDRIPWLCYHRWLTRGGKSWIGAFSVLTHKNQPFNAYKSAVIHSRQREPAVLHSHRGDPCCPRVRAARTARAGTAYAKPHSTSTYLVLSTNVRGKRNPYLCHIGVPRPLDFPRLRPLALKKNWVSADGENSAESRIIPAQMLPPGEQEEIGKRDFYF